ncbi:MAG: hypothetical protein DA408_02185 [Bacteroidetes bacterium]|nr:MAG: hypothetical protein C7N36_00870 [Bacteroidota bacterium]PTM14622.1 MAG: hypothetical protein DA408_02185 [Bacteroidota bacterium]
MGKEEIVKQYSNGEITVEWRPTRCIHAAECVKALPQVYNPAAKPWIAIENATSEALRAQVRKCPSGALTFFENNATTGEATAVAAETKIEVFPNGPLLVHGALQVVDQAGNTETKSPKTAFCRCGASGNKPYCDGSHAKVGFQG